MNDLDDVTFDRFARRFARIERLVPEPLPHAPTVHDPRRSGLRALARPVAFIAVALLLAAVLTFAVIGSRPSPVVNVPPDSASPAVVLDAYLRALRARDCDTADQLVIPLFYGSWNDALCRGPVRIIDYSVSGAPQLFGQTNQVIAAATLQFTGGTNGIPAGAVHFTFWLRQQTGETWRLVRADEAPVPPIMYPRSSPAA